jgi:guanyl-specific ribonuclease Sa
MSDGKLGESLTEAQEGLETSSESQYEQFSSFEPGKDNDDLNAITESTQESEVGSRYSQGDQVNSFNPDETEEVSRLRQEVAPTLERIEKGEKHPHPRDGTVFKNREGLLPQRPKGYYIEYVHPTQGVEHAGLQRIVKGKGGEIYYTSDHYDSFTRLE